MGGNSMIYLLAVIIGLLVVADCCLAIIAGGMIEMGMRRKEK